MLESARGDGDARPREVRAAWTRFAGRLSALIPDPGPDLDQLPVRIPAVAARAAWATAGKWLLLGVLGGSGLTAGLMIERRPPAVDRPGAAVHPTAPPAVPPGEPPPPTEAPEARPSAGEAHRAAARPVAHAGSRSQRALAPSTLAAEVSRIDTARTAIASGDFDQAVRLVERYHHDFPDGALAPDADVVALEAAAAKGDRAEIERRARSFLLRYPNDPHAARVRALADRRRAR